MTTVVIVKAMRCQRGGRAWAVTVSLVETVSLMETDLQLESGVGGIGRERGGV